MAGARILVVEDEPFIRLFVAESLHDAGYDVVEAADGAGAIAQVEGPVGFDLLVTDISMPGGLSGIDVARSFRIRHPGVPVIFATGRPDLLQVLGPGEALVRKPYGSTEVLRLVSSLLPP